MGAAPVIPALPSGFTLDASPATQPTGSNAMPALPPGFTLDASPAAPMATPAANAPLRNPNGTLNLSDILARQMHTGQYAQAASDPNGIIPQAMSGANEGLAGTLSLPNQVARAFESIGPDIVNQFGGHAAMPPANGYLPDAGQAFTNLGTQTGAIKPPSTDPMAQGARTVGQFLGGSVLPVLGETGAAQTGAKAALTAVHDFTSALTAGTAAAASNAVTGNNPWAALAASILGGSSPKTVERGVTPYPISAERQAMVNTLKKSGVDLTAGQTSGDVGLQLMEAELGGHKAQQMMDQTSAQFARAAVSQAGFGAQLATPEVLQRATLGIKGAFEDAAKMYPAPIDAPLLMDVGNVLATYRENATAQAPIVATVRNRIVNLAKLGSTMTGAQYQDLSTRIGTAMKTSDPTTTQALVGLKAALDNAVERGIAATNPADLGMWKQLRNQYKNLLVIKDAANSAGSNAAQGVFSPAQLRSAAAGQNANAYVMGTDNLGPLARAGVATMTPLPNSMTAARGAVRGAFTTLPTLIGAGAGHVSGAGDLLGAIGGFTVGHMIPSLTGKMVLSPALQAYFKNQVLAKPLPGGLGSGFSQVTNAQQR